MGFFAKLFKNRNNNFLCQKTGECPYEYDKDSDRDVEGMPFIENDPRSCPNYGHICPEFMEEFELTVNELNIRATIHCGSLLDDLVQTGEADPESPVCKALKDRYEEVTGRYPRDQYPKYY